MKQTLKTPTKKYVRINEFSIAAGQKSNKQESAAFLCNNNALSEREINLKKFHLQ